MTTRTTSLLPVLYVFIFFLLSCTKDFEENKVPVADAGPSKTITLPIDSETLTGTGTDIDGKVVSYLWSQVSGPAATIIANQGSPSTLIKGFVEGNYIFQLMVTDDKGATGVDTATIVVNPSPIKTLTLQPSNNPLEFEVINYISQPDGYTGAVDIPVMAWTLGGSPLTVREVIKFDLSNIPGNATIISANLYLYSYPAPPVNGNFIDANYGTNNTLHIQQVTSNWSTTNINWFNQPTSTTANQVIVPSTTQSVLDLNLDVKDMVSSMIAGNANYGFLLKLQSEVTYTSRIFVSSYNTTYPAKHPKLVVVYQ